MRLLRPLNILNDAGKSLYNTYIVVVLLYVTVWSFQSIRWAIDPEDVMFSGQYRGQYWNMLDPSMEWIAMIDPAATG